MSWLRLYKDLQFDFELWPCDQNINRNHKISRGIHCTKYGNFLAKGLRNNKRTSFVQSSAVWFDLKKIARGHHLPKRIHCTTFGDFPAKGSKDIVWTSFGLQIDGMTDKCKAICPPLFFKGAINMSALVYFFSISHVQHNWESCTPLHSYNFSPLNVWAWLNVFGNGNLKLKKGTLITWYILCTIILKVI